MAVLFLLKYRSVAGWLRAAARLAYALLPTPAFRMLPPTVPTGLRVMEPALSDEHRRLFLEMFRDASPRFLRWGIRAIMDWQPTAGSPVPVFQVHGRRDRFIPVARVRPDRVIDEGFHLINLTHAGEVNAFVCACLKHGVHGGAAPTPLPS